MPRVGRARGGRAPQKGHRTVRASPVAGTDHTPDHTIPRAALAGPCGWKVAGSARGVTRRASRKGSFRGARPTPPHASSPGRAEPKKAAAVGSGARLAQHQAPLLSPFTATAASSRPPPPPKHKAKKASGHPPLPPRRAQAPHRPNRHHSRRPCSGGGHRGPPPRPQRTPTPARRNRISRSTPLCVLTTPPRGGTPTGGNAHGGDVVDLPQVPTSAAPHMYGGCSSPTSAMGHTDDRERSQRLPQHVLGRVVGQSLRSVPLVRLLLRQSIIIYTVHAADQAALGAAEGECDPKQAPSPAPGRPPPSFPRPPTTESRRPSGTVTTQEPPHARHAAAQRSGWVHCTRGR